MSIVKISNVLNLLAQQSQLNGSLQGYHMGNTLSEIDKNTDNNFNVGNEYGSKFPYLHALLPDGSFLPSKVNDVNYELDLYFYDTQYRDNDGQPDASGLTDVLKITNLEAVAKAFTYNLYQAGAQGLISGIRFTVGNAQVKTYTNATENNLLVYQVTVALAFTKYECPIWNFDISQVPAEYEIGQIGNIDYETVKP